MEYLIFVAGLWLLVPIWKVFSRRTIDEQQTALRDARAYEYGKANREYKRQQKERDAYIKRLIRDDTIVTSTIEKLVEKAVEKALQKHLKKPESA